MSFNEMGIDFKVGFAKDHDGQQWLLRIPRWNDLGDQIEKEKRILDLVKKHLSVRVPDWKIATSTLVAYPLLKDKPALSFHEKTYEVTWHMDERSPNYVPSLIWQEVIGKAKRFIELIIPMLSFVKIKSDVRASRDSNDNYLLSLSKDGAADHLITGDPDLLVLKRYGQTTILTMKEFLEIPR